MHLYKKDEIEVPALVGKSLYEAIALLSKNNLTFRLLTEKDDPDLPEGTIISQVPQARTKVKQNHAVFFVLSKKPPKPTTPNFMNKSYEEIECILQQQNLRSKNYYIPSTYPKGLCIAQLPHPHEQLEGGKITLYISDGNTRPMLFPDFKQKKLGDVLLLLKSYNIEPLITHCQPYPPHNCDTCTIVDQRPLPGSFITTQNAQSTHVQLQVKQTA